jgi:sigma-B regulation protein RsbU (phosphoserine phosphatase)
VQLVLDENPVPQPLVTALHRLGARVSMRSLNKARDRGISSSADVCVILPSREYENDLLDHIMEQANNRACATMVLPPAQNATAEIDTRNPSLRKSLPPETYNSDELAGRIKALCDIRQPMQKMRAELEQLRRRDAQYRDENRTMADQLKLAGQVQTDLLPQPLEDMEPFSLHTLFLPADHVSGDIYDVHQLDQNQFGISLADATGHGIPAALLTILIKNSLRGVKEVGIDGYGLIEPADLLSRLNENIGAAEFSECQFITALNAVLDRSTETIRWARGGMPYPILLRAGQPPKQLPSDGGLLGGFPHQFHETMFHRFQPGDTILFYSDGIESLLLGRKHNGEESILHTSWLKSLTSRNPEEALQDIRKMAGEQNEDQWQRDDITVILLRRDEVT